MIRTILTELAIGLCALLFALMANAVTAGLAAQATGEIQIGETR